MRKAAVVSKESAAVSSELGGTSAVLDLPEAARLLGVGRTLAYQLVRDGQWPTPVVRVGRLIKIPTRPLLDFLGVSG
jgi:excisionase family DNA binding protein